MELFSRDSIDFLVEGHSLREVGNYNEYVVLQVMRKVYAEDPSLCRCPLCTEDVFALSLNSLPPRYIQATSLDVYRDSPYFVGEDQVSAAVKEALAKVSSRPNHGIV